MEKPATKSKNKLVKFLPKATQVAVSFQNPPPFSSNKRPDLNAVHKLRTHVNKGFSGSIYRPMIPVEARGKIENFEITREPTSPKISCMGQIKHKKLCKNMTMPKELKLGSYDSKPVKITKTKHAGPVVLNLKKPEGPVTSDLKKKPSVIKKIFNGRRTSAASKLPPPDMAPSLSEMRRFGSTRDTFVSFDWTTARIAHEDRDFFSDEEYSDGECDVSIPFSVPIIMTGTGRGGRLVLEPKKEINLWKRRTITQLKCLQLNVVGSQ